MIDKYIAINRALRNLRVAISEVMDAKFMEDDGMAVGIAANFVSRAIADLKSVWPREIKSTLLDKLVQLHTKYKYGDWRLMADAVIPKIEDLIDEYYGSQPIGEISHSILDFLHPRIIKCSYKHFRDGRYRDAVLNALISVFDLIRERTGLDKDGIDLIGEVFSIQHPLLAFSNLDTESGKNEQKGFLQILQGSYQGVRNPKAHTLNIKTDQLSTAQYLVLASLLCRKIDECTKVN